MKLFTCTFCLYLLSLNTIAGDAQHGQLMEIHDKNSNPLTKKIEEIHYDLSRLENKFRMGLDAFKISVKVGNINQQLLYHERQLGTPRNHNDHQWNKSERMILGAKIKLQALQDKMSTEGNWGQIKLKMQGLEGKNPGAIKVRYNYGF